VRIDDNQFVMDDGSRYAANLDLLVDADAGMPLRHQVEVTEFMMHEWTGLRWRLAFKVVAEKAGGPKTAAK